MPTLILRGINLLCPSGRLGVNANKNAPAQDAPARKQTARLLCPLFDSYLPRRLEVAGGDLAHDRLGLLVHPRPMPPKYRSDLSLHRDVKAGHG